MAKNNFVSYQEAKILLVQYHEPLRTKLDYLSVYKEISLRLPSDPRSRYADEWVDWQDFLGY